MDENSVEYYGAYYLGALLAAKKKPEEKESLFDRFREWADRITKENV